MSMVAKYSRCTWFYFNNFGAAFYSFLLWLGQWILFSRKCCQPWITPHLEAILDFAAIRFTRYRRSGKWIFLISDGPNFLGFNFYLVSQSSNQKILWTSTNLGHCYICSFCSTRIRFQMDSSLCRWSNHNCLCLECFCILSTSEIGTNRWNRQ